MRNPFWILTVVDICAAFGERSNGWEKLDGKVSLDWPTEEIVPLRWRWISYHFSVTRNEGEKTTCFYDT
jgi:hypothetical protein